MTKSKIIPMTNLVHGAYYYGSSRNTNTARWDASLGKFIYVRYDGVLDQISHPEDQVNCDTFYPTENVTWGVKEIPL